MNKKQKQAFNKCVDLEYLKTRILDLDTDGFFEGDNETELMKYYVFPKKYYKDLCWLSARYGAKFSLRKAKKGTTVHPSYNRERRLIIMCAEKENGYLSTLCVCKEYTHELAHHIQLQTTVECGISPLSHTELGITKLSQIVLYERTADRLAYFLYKKYFSHLCDLHHAQFSAYRSIEDINFLKDYYSEYTPDIKRRSLNKEVKS